MSGWSTRTCGSGTCACTLRRRGAPVKQKSPRWYLAGLVKCGLCGGSVYVNSYAPERSAICCSARRADKSCAGANMYRRQLGKRVAIWLGGHVEEWASVVPQRDAERAEVQGARATRLEEALDGDTAALGKLATGWATGSLDEAGYLTGKHELTPAGAAHRAERSSR